MRDKQNIKIRSDFMDGWNENRGGVHLSDEKRMFDDTEQILDANSMTDEDFANLGAADVLDKYGNIVGQRSVVRRKQSILTNKFKK